LYLQIYSISATKRLRSFAYFNEKSHTTWILSPVTSTPYHRRRQHLRVNPDQEKGLYTEDAFFITSTKNIIIISSK
jgi:hypothetical protein